MSAGTQLAGMFDFIDVAGIQGRTAAAHLVLGNESQLTVRAGGLGTYARPASGPFDAFEVLTSDEAPRFWHRYTDKDAVLFACVPRLLVAHHITRSGGIVDMFCETIRQVRKGISTLQFATSMDSEKRILDALSTLDDVELISREFVHK